MQQKTHIGSVSFTPGALHRQLGVPQGQKIPAAKVAAAAEGKFGPKAKKRASFATGFLAAGRKSALAKAASGR